jgi:hypothetical protein
MTTHRNRTTAASRALVHHSLGTQLRRSAKAATISDAATHLTSPRLIEIEYSDHCNARRLSH